MEYNDDVDFEDAAKEFHETKLSTYNSNSLIDGIAIHVFKDYIQNSSTGPSTSSQDYLSSLTFINIWKNVCKQLKHETLGTKPTPSWDPRHRIGPSSVGFNKKCVGSFEFKDNDLEISSKDNFSTIYADTCVFQGKWQYEVTLGSKGVMQIGWATLKCEFSQENGVGDTQNSYAYDGNRQRKWNVTTRKYGEMWNCGDVISCTMDLERGEITYYRNGRSMCVAFTSVSTGPGIAYFPAFSLAIDECLLANFGESPFCYPQTGFQPLQAPPTEHLVKAKKCLSLLNKLIRISEHWNEYPDLMALEKKFKGRRKVSLLLIAELIGTRLAPLLTLPYVIEEALIPVLMDYAKPIYGDVGGGNLSENETHFRKAHSFFQFLMAVLQEEEQKSVLSTLVMCLQRQYRRISLSFDYNKQKCSLKLLHLLLSEQNIRKFCLRNVLFDKESHYRFMNFVSINCVDKINFRNFADIHYWSSKNGKFCYGSKESFYKKINSVELATRELEDLQVNILRLLFTSDDSSSYNETSRALFLAKFRFFIKDQLIGGRLSVASFIPAGVILSLFNCCLVLFIRLWKEELEEMPEEDTLPASIFYDGVLDYFETQRLGGLESHLKKQHSVERSQALQDLKEKKQFLCTIEASKHNALSNNLDISLPSTSGTVLGQLLLTVNEGIQRINVQGMEDVQHPKRTIEELRTSLLHLFDGVVLLYHHAGHKQIEKIVAQTDLYFENVTYYEELINKKNKYLSEQGNASSAVLDELKRSANVIESKLKEQSYQQAWNLATVMSLENTKRMQTFFKVVLGALQESSKSGGLFTFVPDFYVETLTQICQDLKHLILCDQNFERKESEEIILYLPGGNEIPKQIAQDYLEVLMKAGEFLALHFNDSRIVYADSKDSLIQALAGFVCHRPGLESLEKMPLKSRETMIKSLLQPYENRAWAQNNWILVRFWKGKGFGFRFTKSPHLCNRLGPKPTHYEIPNNISTEPYFSEVFLTHVSEALNKTEISTPFLNSLLNQLNWVFSEFIGMLQEIQNASNRPERVFIDSRQLRICATCFDLTLALLRVLEMIVSVAPNIFLDPNKQDSKPLLTRLFQLLCQVLNRVNVSSGCFSHVVNLEIPGLETIHYFPILTAVIGIICELLKKDINDKKDEALENSATKVFLDDPSFQMNSLYPLLGGKAAIKPRAQILDSTFSQEDEEETTMRSSSSADSLFLTPECECKYLKFCLRKYPEDILEFELRKVVEVIHHLENVSSRVQNVSVEDNEGLCTICYANISDAVFVPCGHTSCSSCITQYMMNQTDCFFCLKAILMVKDSTGKVIYTSPESKNSSS